MKKVISLFKRDYEGTRLVFDEIVEGAEWVAAGEGVATRKYDGTCCMVLEGILYKRYDRKLKREKKELLRSDPGSITTDDFKPAPADWEPAQLDPDENSGHWPGWVPVLDGPEDRWHREAFDVHLSHGTYELCGSKIQGNPEKISDAHVLIPHGEDILEDAPRSFDDLREWFKGRDIEGVVWHHPDGRMVKIKKKDFGLKRHE